MRKPVALSNGREWKSRTDAKNHFKAMLGRYANGEIVDGEQDISDLAALLDRFDALIAEETSKIGEGIAHFERRLNRRDGWSSPGFWVVRVDGSATDFSYVKAVDGTPMSLEQEFYNACHNAVAGDLQNMKQYQFDHFVDADGFLECDITGELISFAQAQLSHASPPFGEIVTAFRERMGWDEKIPTGILTPSGDAQISTQFLDEGHAAEFLEYHHSVAVLRIVSKKPSADPKSIKLAPVKRPLVFN
ncbi:DCL family protein [Devosia sp. J2-20]|uniref:DCL family protein n=1 Tax=Devosia sp. J2-20 TaxID=3026161 RepID=UPI00249C8F55|nr:DCL family protein [Devosia sp. J2-20]WDR00856.1 DCL family protein [Devosia sp. J2-20]